MIFFGIKEKTCNTCWLTFTILISIFHAISFFLMKKPYYQILDDILNSSPLFDFEISPSCINKTAVVFHKWPGRNISFEERDRIINEYDKADITIIHGQKFCYKSKTYKELLYNNQIQKNNCDYGYKSCGVIDTLGQILCINDTEKCPLYDVWIGKPDNFSNYTYSEKSGIYYNNENYLGNEIIGNLILSDGQPCYYNDEILWRKFHRDEKERGWLQCIKDVFGKKNDDRYKERGNITYKELYEDNLSDISKMLIIKRIKNETVSLYKRLILGINIDLFTENKNIEKSFEILGDNTHNFSVFLIIKFLVIFLSDTIIIVIYNKCYLCEDYHILPLLFNLALFVTSSVFGIIYFEKIINNREFFSFGDEISNEMIKDISSETDYNITLLSFDLAVDIIFSIFLILIIIPINADIKKCKLFKCCYSDHDIHKDTKIDYFFTKDIEGKNKEGESNYYKEKAYYEK